MLSFALRQYSCPHFWMSHAGTIVLFSPTPFFYYYRFFTSVELSGIAYISVSRLNEEDRPPLFIVGEDHLATLLSRSGLRRCTIVRHHGGTEGCVVPADFFERLILYAVFAKYQPTITGTKQQTQLSIFWQTHSILLR